MKVVLIEMSDWDLDRMEAVIMGNRGWEELILIGDDI